MVAGPFDLSGVTTALLNFDLWLNTEPSYDYFYYYASADGSTFSGYRTSGSTGGSWSPLTLDLANAPDGLGGTVSLVGDNSVWIAFRFTSDDTINYEGAYLDDVELVTSTSLPPVITGMTPGSGSAGTGTQVTITGSAFGAAQGAGRVEFFYRSGQPRVSAPVVSWSDTSIVCTVPTALVDSYPASAGSGPVTVVTSTGMTSNEYAFNVTFGYGGLRWDTPSCSYRLNPNTSDTSEEETLFDAGAATWNPASAFKFNDDGLTSATSSTGNFINEVYWSNSISAGTLAVTTYRWYTSSPDRIIDADIGFNDNYTWGTGSPGTYDIQSIASHELGHCLNLRDLYGTGDSAKLMYGFGGAGTQKRTLDASDAAGIVWIYGAANAPPIAGTVNIIPDPVLAGTRTFTATPAGFSDPDSDPLAYHYAWTINSVAVGTDSATLSSVVVAKNDVVAVSVYASDGSLSSDTATDSVTVGNSAPVAGTVNITPDPVLAGTRTFTPPRAASATRIATPSPTTTPGP